MKNKNAVLKILAELCRLLIGVVFIFSGFVKAVDPMGGAIKIGEYLASFGLDMLQPFTVLLSFNLSAIEFALGVCMLLGVYRRYVSFLILAFMAFMTPLTLYLALFDPVSDCGCFGDALVISNWETFFKNIVLSLAAIVTFIYNQRLFQCFTFRAYWFVALYAYLFGVGFAYYNYNHLPVIDFRPYKIGANIPKLMEMPEEAPQDEYKYTFVYEKDGVKKEFSLEDYPANDSSWTFVDSKTELVKKGYQPPVAAFNIYNGKGDDVTEEIIGNPDPVLLLVAPKPVFPEFPPNPLLLPKALFPPKPELPLDPNVLLFPPKALFPPPKALFPPPKALFPPPNTPPEDELLLLPKPPLPPNPVLLVVDPKAGLLPPKPLFAFIPKPI